MSLKYLLDEHVPPALAAEMQRRAPSISVLAIGEGAAPPRGTLDPEVLEWCEQHGHVLVTNNRASMPLHLAQLVARGAKVPGIFVLKSGWGVGQTADHLILVALASLEGEYEKQIRFLPLL